MSRGIEEEALKKISKGTYDDDGESGPSSGPVFSPGAADTCLVLLFISTVTPWLIPRPALRSTLSHGAHGERAGTLTENSPLPWEKRDPDKSGWVRGSPVR